MLHQKLQNTNCIKAFDKHDVDRLKNRSLEQWECYRAQECWKELKVTKITEMKRDVEMENMYGMCNYFKNSISRFPFVNSK